MTPPTHYRCWVEIDLHAFRRNVAAIRRRIAPQTKFMAVVKANAYGHGLIPVAEVLLQCPVDAFAVANLTESLALRQVCGPDKPILQFGSPLPFEIEKMIDRNITPTVSTLEEARVLETVAAKCHRRIRVHVEIDTGMGRSGFWHEDIVADIRQIISLPHLQIEALYTHFPSADENLEQTKKQLELFIEVAREASKPINPKPILHTANSAGLLNLPEASLDMVRPGLVLYGVCPAGSTPVDVWPALSFKTRVTYVKSVKAGRAFSYGQTFIASKPMKIATVAVGYADGFNRQLTNKGEVLIEGQRCRVVGRVTMDQIMVDVTGVANVSNGDEVVLIGRQGDAIITAGEVADWAGTIPWDILCGISQSARVPRIYCDSSLTQAADG